MVEDILTQIERGRRVGYSDSLIKKSLELEGYSNESIKQAFREVEQRKNGNSTKYSVKNVRVDTTQLKKMINNQISENTPLIPTLKIPPQAQKRTILLDVAIGIVMFALVGILMYLFIVPSLISTV